MENPENDSRWDGLFIFLIFVWPMLLITAFFGFAGWLINQSVPK